MSEVLNLQPGDWILVAHDNRFGVNINRPLDAFLKDYGQAKIFKTVILCGVDHTEWANTDYKYIIVIPNTTLSEGHTLHENRITQYQIPSTLRRYFGRRIFPIKPHAIKLLCQTC